MIRLIGCVLVVSLLLAPVGCGEKTVPSINIQPDRFAAEAMAMYDANKDGKLDANELKKCPALASALADVDKNDDKCIDAEELSARFAFYNVSGTRLRGERPQVMRGARPAVGVTVTLEPEKFMGDSIKAATGVSNDEGTVILKSEGQPFEGAQIGFYQIVVSQKDASGKELIPAKFNNPSTLGVEIGPNNRVNLYIDLDK